jgi:hypothetical protein
VQTQFMRVVFIGSLTNLLGYTLALSAAGVAGPEPIPFRAPAKLPDAAELLSPGAVRLQGFLGARVMANATNRLLKVDEEPLLAGFRKKPGSHPWIGEHVGKWMHAATLAWAYTGEPALRAKLDRVAAELIKTQEPDGYLGTYTPDKRFGLYPGADWDVWSHKYNLMGLLTYYQYTGNADALTACRKIGDLLIATFGPGKKSILSAGTHVGMAATSVLEPVVLLYRFTGEDRYLEFARYLVRAWDEPNGPKIIATLLKDKAVNKTANGKAYEMLSNLVGLCELARATGDHQFLEPVLIAWADIVAHRLYLTGSASQGEHFRDDYYLPNHTGASVAEMCVTTTWIQLNSQLLRLTGEARFANELERTFYNHLAAAQRPDGAEWCYFTALEGSKPYGPGINCCVSSGPRGMALAPQHAWLKYRVPGGEGLIASLFERSEVKARIGGQLVAVAQESDFPSQGRSAFLFHLAQPAAFGFRLRAPDWALPVQLMLNGKAIAGSAAAAGWLEIAPRTWRDGDRLEASYKLAPLLVQGDHGNAGKVAWTWGPFVLACDQKRNEGLPPSGALAIAGPNPSLSLKSADPLAFAASVRSARQPEAISVTLVPFADAGRDGGFYRVWLRAPGAALPQNLSLLSDGVESRSRRGNVAGSINDAEADSYVVTFDGKPAAEDWFAVTTPGPITISRVVFRHGSTFHDGGWFDTTAGKPRIQVRRDKDSQWETVAELADYPATSATDSAGLKPGQAFSQPFPAPTKVTAVRVIGKPACGDSPAQAFASCAELEAFGE